VKKTVILSVIALGALIAAGVYASRSVRNRDSDHIVISGNIELTQVNIAFKTAGKLVERSVNEGDEVHKGMVVARLDREQLLRQRERERAGLSMSEALLAEARTAVNWQRQMLQVDLEQRNAELASADARLRELSNGSRPQEIQQATAAVESAQSEYDRAKKDWERAQTLHGNDDISTAQFDQFRTRFTSAEAALREAKERLSLVQAGPRREVVEGATAQVSRARAGLKISEANQLELARREQEVTARQADIQRAQAQISLIDAQLEDTIAASPIDGIVLVKSADVGEVLAPGTTVLTIGDLRHPWLRGYVSERVLGRVKIGSAVRLTTDSFPGKVHSGRVSFIASEAEFTPKQIQTQEERVKLVYRVKIDIDNPQQELKSNMPVDAEVLVGN
jgi:HlyD family secretion protein